MWKEGCYQTWRNGEASADGEKYLLESWISCNTSVLHQVYLRRDHCAKVNVFTERSLWMFCMFTARVKKKSLFPTNWLPTTAKHDKSSWPFPDLEVAAYHEGWKVALDCLLITEPELFCCCRCCRCCYCCWCCSCSFEWTGRGPQGALCSLTEREPREEGMREDAIIY